MFVDWSESSFETFTDRLAAGALSLAPSIENAGCAFLGFRKVRSLFLDAEIKSLYLLSFALPAFF